MNNKLWHVLGIWIITSIIILCGNAVIYIRLHPKVYCFDSITRSLPGMAILIVFALMGMLCKYAFSNNIPTVAYIVTIACFFSIPGVPGSEGRISQFMNIMSGTIMKYVNEINFMSLTTPVLAYVGLSLAKDIEAFRINGWKLVIVSFFVFIGTFLGSVFIADFVLKALGQV